MGEARKHTIEVYQVNLNKCYMAQVEIANKIGKDKAFLALIQEPYCYKSRPCLIPKGIDRITFNDKPRAMILASKHLQLKQVTHLCTQDAAVAITKLAGKNTVVASIYLDINLGVITKELQDIVNFAGSRRYSLLIGVDSNSHSKLWQSKNDNSRGRLLTDFIIENGINVENLGIIPTFECSTGKSIIDLTLTRGLALGIKKWRVCRQANHSDHNTIKFSLEDTVITLPPHRPWGKADWGLFENEIEKAELVWPEFVNTGVIDKLINDIYIDL